MDAIHTPDNRIDALGTLHCRTTRSGVAFGVRAQVQEQQQEQQQEQMLPLQRSLEAGQS
jgi:hypothetical protein